MSRAIISVENVVKTFDSGKIRALDGVNLGVDAGEFLAIQGPSGSGKSTLLHLIGALERPDSGQIIVDGQDLSRVKNLNRFRAETVGFVFQLHNLIPQLTALENVMIPTVTQKAKGKSKKEKAMELLGLVGLEQRANHAPPRLSGGERQRVAIARALANEPKIILADEPTGNIDSKTGAQVIDLLRKLRQEKGVTLVMVTHDPGIAQAAERIIHLLDGKIVDS